MSTWKMPPKAKVYEALSAVADQRVVITGLTSAQVQSSSRDKTYNIITLLDQIEEKGGNRAEIVQEVEKIYQQLGTLGLQRAQLRHQPPKGRPL